MKVKSDWRIRAGMKNSPTAASARISRERSSSRCEISVPSESFQAPPHGMRVWRGGVCSGGRCGRLCRRGGAGAWDLRPALHVLGFPLRAVAN